MGAAVAVLFSPVPALADPGAAAVPLPNAVPDVGSRPIALGTLVLPGQKTATATSATPLPGVANSPVLQQIQKGRDDIAALGDRLIQLVQDRDAAKAQQATADEQYAQAQVGLREAQSEAAEAAAADVFEAAALPPGAVDPGLIGLNDLAQMQRGKSTSAEAAARRLTAAQTAERLALDAQTQAAARYADLVAQHTRLNAELTKKQAAQQQLELAHASELTAAEVTATAVDRQLGAAYLAGQHAGRGADARALQALQFALAQRGKPYVWGTEGLDTYDCSGLMWRAYQSVGFQLDRVSRDQYKQTSERAVDRYSLLPGDLLFFSYSNSWTGIHHVAMYAGEGMMVEAPRTGLNVRLVEVRWSQLFQATRVFGSVPGVTTGPDLGPPDPNVVETTPPLPSPSGRPGTSRPTASPSHSAGPSTPPATTTTPSTSPSPSPNPEPTSGAPTASTSPSASDSGLPSAEASAAASAAASASGGTTAEDSVASKSTSSAGAK